MVLDRKILENPQSLESMRSIIDRVTDDRENFPDERIHRRVGIVKDIVEEYIPLLKLSRTLNNFRSARLTPASLSGPDALITLADGMELGVQITTAGETTSTALHRKMLARSEVVFPNQTAERNKIAKEIMVSGRVLSTRPGNTKQLIHDVGAAVERKCRAYRNGSQILLISSGISIITLTEDWPQLLTSAFKNIGLASYNSVYVTVGEKCVKILPQDESNCEVVQKGPQENKAR